MDEIAKLTTDTGRRIKAFEHKCHRTVLCTSYKEHKRKQVSKTYQCVAHANLFENMLKRQSLCLCPPIKLCYDYENRNTIQSSWLAI